MRTISVPAGNVDPEITREMLEAGYAVIGEFDPDITCLASEEEVHALLKAVYIAMREASLGADAGFAIGAGSRRAFDPSDPVTRQSGNAGN